MNKKLYVGNLAYSVDNAALEQAFGEFGEIVSAEVLMDKFSGRSKGFGFVEMSSSDEANAAINMFHGKDFNGRPLTVNLARPREERSGGGGGFRGGGGRRQGGGDRERRRDY